MKRAIVVSCSLLLLSAPLAAAQSASPAPNGPGLTARSGESTRTADVAPDYRMVPGDKLRIEVYKDPQLSQSLQIRPDGKITVPLVGDVPAAGSTPRELAATLTERLREYVTAPVVTVIVAEAMPTVIYVMGEVNSPGAQPLSEPRTVLQALAVAGGFRDFANTKKIRILRKADGGKMETVPFDYKAAVDGSAKPMFLQPGDTVIVP
jgi:polysaccharide export outer membrane protein